jgi:HK97 family phage major capsid protein
MPNHPILFEDKHMSKLKELHQRRAELVVEGRTLLDKANAEKRNLSDEEATSYNTIRDEVESVGKSIEREERQIEMERELGNYRPEHDDDDETRDRNTDRNTEERQGFATLGEQLQAVAGFYSGRSSYDADPRLQELRAASGASANVPSDGGFLIQTDFSTALLGQMHEMGEILSRVRMLPLSGNSNGTKLPAIDETSRVDGSRFGGVRGYWANEADTVTSSKPKFRTVDLTLEKLFALGYATEELLQDAALLEAVMTQAFTEELTFKTENAVINGTGSGQPLGILNANCLVTVTKESGQSADTVQTANILNMWSRMPARSRRNAVWYINQDIEAQLYPLTLGSGTAVTLLYTPPGTRGNQYGLLMGRPVIPVEYCATLGDAGDIILADPTQYIMIEKNGPRAESSMHVRFIYDEMTFRFIYRVDGQPAPNSAITPYKGSNTVSPFVTLGAR